MTLSPQDARADLDRPGVLFVGLATVDVLHGVGRVPGSNEKMVAAWQDVCAGGPATNAAIACAQQSGPGHAATVLGTHPLSAIVRDDSRAAGRRARRSPRRNWKLSHRSRPYSSTSEPATWAVVSANTGAWPCRLAPIPETAFEHVGVVLVDGHHVSAAIEAARRARERGLTTVMDGGSWKPGTEVLLAHIDVAICSADFQPPGGGAPAAVGLCSAGTALARRPSRTGPIPSCAGKTIRAASIPVPPVYVVDTLGAGDVLHGAFCYYLAAAQPRGSAAVTGAGRLPPGEFLLALEAAVAVASRALRSPGTRAWMQD